MIFKSCGQWIRQLFENPRAARRSHKRRHAQGALPIPIECCESRIVLAATGFAAGATAAALHVEHNDAGAGRGGGNRGESQGEAVASERLDFSERSFDDHAADQPQQRFGSEGLRGFAHHRFEADDNSDDSSTNSDGTHLVFIVEPSDTTAGQTNSVSVSVEDADGNVVTGNNSTITLQVADGSGDFASGRTLTATAVDGVATFDNVVLDKAGTYTLSARSDSRGRTTSDSFTVAPDTTDTEQLAFLSSSDSDSNSDSHGCDHSHHSDDTSSSSSDSSASTDSTDSSSSSSNTSSSSTTSASTTTGTAGQALSTIRVAVKDQFGNIVISDNSSTVTLAVNSGPTNAVVDSASVMTATVKNGVATFNNVILDTAGQYTLSATDSNSAVTTAVSDPITVKAAAASQLVVQPVTTPATVGQAISPSVTVTAEDAFGNLATDDNNSVTLSLASGAAGNFTSGSTTTVQATNGVATFDNVAFDTATATPAGTNPYFLIATQGTLTSANSNAIEVNATA